MVLLEVYTTEQSYLRNIRDYLRDFFHITPQGLDEIIEWSTNFTQEYNECNNDILALGQLFSKVMISKQYLVALGNKSDTDYKFPLDAYTRINSNTDLMRGFVIHWEGSLSTSKYRSKKYSKQYRIRSLDFLKSVELIESQAEDFSSSKPILTISPQTNISYEPSDSTVKITIRKPNRTFGGTKSCTLFADVCTAEIFKNKMNLLNNANSNQFNSTIIGIPNRLNRYVQLITVIVKEIKKKVAAQAHSSSTLITSLQAAAKHWQQEREAQERKLKATAAAQKKHEEEVCSQFIMAEEEQRGSALTDQERELVREAFTVGHFEKALVYATYNAGML